ncbi:MAG: TetR/AcrR family transcriptional regulator [Chitinophagaceae bacterium]|nr:MAG: TetR/AcrR family transcriptional regulator [Chitinophagaceae bacterium]
MVFREWIQIYQKNNLIKRLFKSNICLTLPPQLKKLEMEYGDKQMQIMEAAEELFAENGFNGTSVRDISEKAGVNLAMISYYFGSKDKLLEAIFSLRGESTKLVLEEIVNKPNLPSIEKVYLLIDHYIKKITDQQCFHRIMVREQSVNNSGPIAALILNLKKRNFETVKKLISDGQKNGEFRKNIDAHLLMTTMLGTTNQLITSQYYYREINNLQDMAEDEFQKHLHKKLSTYLKFLFKTILTNEA